jgi:hypothetical protein
MAQSNTMEAAGPDYNYPADYAFGHFYCDSKVKVRD